MPRFGPNHFIRKVSPPPRRVWEWIVTLLGVVAFLVAGAVVGYLAWLSLR